MKRSILYLLIAFIVCIFSSCYSLLGLGLALALEENDVNSSDDDSVNSKATEIVYVEIPYSELEQSLGNINSPGHGFIVEAYFTYASENGTYKISETQGSTPSGLFRVHEDDNSHYFNYVRPEQFERYDDQTYRRVDFQKKCKIYFGVYYFYSREYWVTRIDKIEGLRTMEEVAAFEAQQRQEREAAEASRRKAAAEAREAKQNPGGLDRSLYKEITVEDFSFDMVAGRLPVDSKIFFEAKFFSKPTGTRYTFDDVNFSIILSTDHNFVRDIPDGCFERRFNILRQVWEVSSVKVYVTVKRAGQTGECSVDIMEWR
jgi:hypothetical protein